MFRDAWNLRRERDIKRYKRQLYLLCVYYDTLLYMFRSGYRGGSCDENIDECLEMPRICGENATCNDTRGRYIYYVYIMILWFTCFRSGYRGGSCDENINECLEMPGICGENATCNDTRGNFLCVCDPGFIWKNASCQGIRSFCILFALYSPLFQCCFCIFETILNCQ